MSKTDSYYHFLPFAILYFFGNNLFLPEGLLYTAILTPVFLYFIYREKSLFTFLKWSILLIFPIPFQLISGVDLSTYAISTTLVFTAWIFFFAAIYAIIRSIKGQEDIFRTILIINTILIFIAFLVLPFNLLRENFWYEIPISPSIPGFPRLKLLAYEPSHYALLLSPVFLFFLLKATTGQSKHTLIVFLAASLPLLFSLSFGVIGALTLAIVTGTIIYYNKLPKAYWSFVFYSMLFVVTIAILVWIIWPSNPVYLRISNIFSGEDTSARGRLYNSFWFAFDLIKEHNFIMGVGPGQVKVLAHEMIIDFYKYSGEYAEIVRIPNSMGEMLATYGVYGFVLKLFFEIYFFLYFKVYKNFFNLILFLFIFIYQFTGSFLINVAELGIWAFVFNARFERFDSSKIKSESI